MPTSHPTTRRATRAEYEYRVLTFPRDVSRGDIRRTLGEHAEYDHWELTRTVVYVGGVRRAWLRRRVIRVRRTA
jgi:hypothetical protein